MNTPERKAQIKRQNEAAQKKRAKMPLTKIETEIINLIYQEMTSKEIADKLGKSKKTIDNHRLFIIKKLKVKNVVGIVKYAIKKKLIKR